MGERRVHVWRPRLKLSHQTAKSTCPILRITRLLRAEVPLLASLTISSGDPRALCCLHPAHRVPDELHGDVAWGSGQWNLLNGRNVQAAQRSPGLGLRAHQVVSLSFDSQDNGAGLQGEADHLSGSTGVDFAFQGTVDNVWVLLWLFYLGVGASSGRRPGTLLDILQCAGQCPPQRILWPQMSVLLRLSPVLYGDHPISLLEWLLIWHSPHHSRNFFLFVKWILFCILASNPN